MSWRDSAIETINAIHERLGPNATYQERAKALRDGYPFGERKYTPYKVWLQERNRYLARWSPDPAGPLFAPTVIDKYNAEAIAHALERTPEE